MSFLTVKSDPWNLKSKLHGAGIVAKFQGIDTPEDAAALRGAVALYRKDFPEAEENEYYWVDLIGCEVVNKEGQSIGQVKGMIDNGVHDILKLSNALTVKKFSFLLSKIFGRSER